VSYRTRIIIATAVQFDDTGLYFKILPSKAMESQEGSEQILGIKETKNGRRFVPDVTPRETTNYGLLLLQN
jgi:hypothetical protein